MLWRVTYSSFSKLTHLDVRPCEIEGNCTCTSLWDSDCYCDDKPISTFVPKCNCTKLVDECWKLRTHRDYGLAACAKGAATKVLILSVSVF